VLLTPEQQSRVAQIRAKALAGQAEADDYKEYILILRQSRNAASTPSPKAGKAKRAPVDASSLFDELDKLK
jgi:hypothetical protein